MKIAIILRRLNIKGGTQRQALLLAHVLKKMGHTVDIYAIHYNRENCYQDLLKTLDVYTLNQKEKERAENVGFVYSIFAPIKTFVKETRLARALAKKMSADYTAINPHDQLSYRVAYFYKKKHKYVPSVWNMNDLPLKQWCYDKIKACDEEFSQPFYKIWAYKFFDAYDNKKYISKMNGIVVLDYFNRHLVKKYLGHRAFTVRSGQDFERYVFKDHIPPKNNSVSILTSGIFFPHRRYEDAINGVKILKDQGFNVKITIVGDTQTDRKYFEKILKLVGELKLKDEVKFAGVLTDPELMNAYHTHNIYTFQHHLQTGGLSPLEASASGMPLILSKTAGCHEVFEDGKNALFINPKDPNDYAQKVRKLIEDPILYTQLARNGNSKIRELLTWVAFANGILSVIDKAKSAPLLALEHATDKDEFNKNSPKIAL